MNPRHTPPVRCILCDIPPRRPFRLAAGAWLEQCPRCRMAWWAWPAFEPGAFYDEAYFQSPASPKGYDDYAALEPGIRRTARSRLRRIGRILHASGPAPPRLLEIGCGTGLFLDEARRAGWEVRGVEVSAYAAQAARARGIAVDQRPAEDADLPAGRFDCVAMWDVLEHVRDPLHTVRAASDALRAGGVLALSTGDVTSLCAWLTGPRWHLFNLPEHLYFFSARSLRELSRRAHCRVARIVHEVNWVPLAYIVERLRKGGGLAGRIAGYCAPRVVGTATGERVVPATLFDILGVYAIRT